LLLLVSVLSLVSTGKLDLVTMLVAPAALLFKGYRWWHGHSPEISNRAATRLMTGYVAFFLLDLTWVSRILSADAQNPGLFAALLAAIHLMLFAMIVRLFSARTTRDCLFLALLAFTAMLASAILTVDTAFIGFFLVFLALCVSTFVGLEMRRGAEGATWTPLESGTPAAKRLHTALGVTCAGVAMSALIGGVLIFLALPRFRAGYLSGFNLQPGLISGFSDEAELGQIGQIQQSSEVVMRIRVEGDSSLAENTHWRGIAFTNFDGRRWFTQDRESRGVSQSADNWIHLLPFGTRPRPRALRLHYTVFLEPVASDAVFVAAEPVQVRGQFTSSSTLPRNFRRSYLLQDKTGSLSNPFHNFADVSYDAISEVPRDLDDALRRAPRTYPNSIRQMYLQFPDLDPRIPALARQIVASERNPLDQARAIERYLPEHYAYTLDLAGPPPADPLAHFLFETRAGHCEYFASAMTIMLRTLGIPARYVTGFFGGEYNDVGGDYILRASNAHSWVEAYFPGYGWVTFDPTPPGAADPANLMTRLGFYWDWFQLQWSEWIINYDFLHQDALVQNLRNTSRDWSGALRRRIDRARDAGAERLRRWQSEIPSVPPWIPIVLVAMAALALSVGNAELRERVALAWRLRLRSGALPLQTAALSYRRMLRLLERAGWTKSPDQTPLEFAAALPSGQLGTPVTGLTELYQAARFGGQNPDAAKLTSLLAEVQAALGSHKKR
jgi:transglutaminase-like putative cysteine protease